MPAQWTGRLIGEIHNAGLTIKQVALEADLNPRYVSQVLNRDSDSEKAREKLQAALERMVKRHVDMRLQEPDSTEVKGVSERLFHCKTIGQFKIMRWLAEQGVTREDIDRVEFLGGWTSAPPGSRT